MIATWALAGYSKRRSLDKPPSETGHNSRPSSPDGEARLSSSSEATPRPTPAPHPQHLASAAAHDPNHNVLGSYSASEFSGSSRRLGFFTDKLSTSQASHPLNASGSGHTPSQRSILPGLLHSHNPLRSESALSMAPTTSSSTNKLHNAPSKVSCSCIHIYKTLDPQC